MAGEGGPHKPRGPQSLHPCTWPGLSVLVASHGLGSPASALYPPVTPGTAGHAIIVQMACWWIRSPLPPASCLRLSQGVGRVGSQRSRMDRTGKKSLHVVGTWKKLENQLSSLFAVLPRCGPAAWVSKVSLGRRLRSFWPLIRASAAKDPVPSRLP